MTSRAAKNVSRKKKKFPILLNEFVSLATPKYDVAPLFLFCKISEQRSRDQHVPAISGLMNESPDVNDMVLQLFGRLTLWLSCIATVFSSTPLTLSFRRFGQIIFHFAANIL